MVPLICLFSFDLRSLFILSCQNVRTSCHLKIASVLATYFVCQTTLHSHIKWFIREDLYQLKLRSHRDPHCHYLRCTLHDVYLTLERMATLIYYKLCSFCVFSHF